MQRTGNNNNTNNNIKGVLLDADQHHAVCKTVVQRDSLWSQGRC